MGTDPKVPPTRVTAAASCLGILVCLPYTLNVTLLGGPWDLVTTYNWAYNPTYNFPEWASRGYPNYK